MPIIPTSPYSDGTSPDPKSSIGRWRKELSQDELGKFDAEFGEFFDLFGYERHQPIVPVKPAAAAKPERKDGQAESASTQAQAAPSQIQPASAPPE